MFVILMNNNVASKMASTMLNGRAMARSYIQAKADWRESGDGHLLIDTYVRCTRIHEIMTLLAEVRRNLGFSDCFPLFQLVMFQPEPRTHPIHHRSSVPLPKYSTKTQLADWALLHAKAFGRPSNLSHRASCVILESFCNI